MYQTTSQNAVANLATLLDMAIIEKQPVVIDTVNGQALLISADDSFAKMSGYLPPLNKPKGKRPIGFLDGIAEVYFADDFKITDEEFLKL